MFDSMIVPVLLSHESELFLSRCFAYQGDPRHAYETRHARETRRQASLLPDFRYQKIPGNRDIFVVKKRLELSCDQLTAECFGSSAIELTER